MTVDVDHRQPLLTCSEAKELFWVNESQPTQKVKSDSNTGADEPENLDDEIIEVATGQSVTMTVAAVAAADTSVTGVMDIVTRNVEGMVTIVVKDTVTATGCKDKVMEVAKDIAVTTGQSVLVRKAYHYFSCEKPVKMGTHRISRRERRLAESRKKWRTPSTELEVNFNFSLMPRRTSNVNNDFIEEYFDYDDLLNYFECNTCTKRQTEADDNGDTGFLADDLSVELLNEQTMEISVKNICPSGADCKSTHGDDVDKVAQGMSASRRCRRRRIFAKQSSISRDVCDYPDYLLTIMAFEDRLTSREVGILEGHQGAVMPLRSKKKWTVMKARNQVKTKHCRRVDNCPHGQILYVHHRVSKQMMHMDVQVMRTFQVTISLRRIDKLKGIAVGCSKKQLKSSNVNTNQLGRKSTDGSEQIRPLPAYAIDAYNADGDLEPDLVNILLILQQRDLTPEDYELLLRLDNRVKPKTLSLDLLQALNAETVAEGLDADDDNVCGVCLDAYVAGQTRKCLPCGHRFHSDCIDSWLSSSSMICPLDGTPVDAGMFPTTNLVG